MIKTSRTIIRPFIEEDLDVFVEYRNNNEWMKYQSFKGLTNDAYRSSLLIPFSIENGGQLAIALPSTNELIGDLYLHKTLEGIYLGYTVHPSFSRKGYVYEVVKEVVTYLKETYDNEKIIAETDEGNIASRKLLLKCGFKCISASADGYVFEQ